MVAEGGPSWAATHYGVHVALLHDVELRTPTILRLERAKFTHAQSPTSLS